MTRAAFTIATATRYQPMSRTRAAARRVSGYKYPREYIEQPPLDRVLDPDFDSLGGDFDPCDVARIVRNVRNIW